MPSVEFGCVRLGCVLFLTCVFIDDGMLRVSMMLYIASHNFKGNASSLVEVWGCPPTTKCCPPPREGGGDTHSVLLETHVITIYFQGGVLSLGTR
jgi:hypothetical protein